MSSESEEEETSMPEMNESEEEESSSSDVDESEEEENRMPEVDEGWIPPKSPFNLIQESLWEDPWQLLVATVFLNSTNKKKAIPILWKFLDRWPTPEDARDANPADIAEVLRPLGLHDKRSKIIVRMSEEFLTTSWMYPKELYGIGRYGNDSYRIFCFKHWQLVKPKDKELKKYIEYVHKTAKQ